MFENGVLRIIFGPMIREVAEGWKEIHNEGLHNLHDPSNIIRVIKPRKMRRVGHVACRGHDKYVHDFSRET
jgi:hypothetical protein